MNEPLVIVERPASAVTEMSLNRVDRRNALNVSLVQQLCDVVEQVSHDTDQRVLILRGRGPVFCAGLDLYEAADQAQAEQSGESLERLLELLWTSPLVTICAAHTAAYGGGAGLLVASDLAVASDDLKTAFPETRRGLIPALVSAIAGYKLSGSALRELFLLAEPIDAQRALALGLVQRVVPGEQLIGEARRMAHQILQGGPQATRQTKQLLGQLHASHRDAFRVSAHDCHLQARTSSEAREGLAAFLEKRAPDWVAAQSTSQAAAEDQEPAG